MNVTNQTLTTSDGTYKLDEIELTGKPYNTNPLGKNQWSFDFKVKGKTITTPPTTNGKLVRQVWSRISEYKPTKPVKEKVVKERHNEMVNSGIVEVVNED